MLEVSFEAVDEVVGGEEVNVLACGIALRLCVFEELPSSDG